MTTDRLLPRRRANGLRRDRQGRIVAELRSVRDGEWGVQLIMLAAVLAGTAVVLVLPDRPLPALPLAALAAALEVRTRLDRRIARLEAELAKIQAVQLAHYRLYLRSGRAGPPPRLR